MSDSTQQSPNSPLARPTTSGKMSRKAKKAQHFNPVDLKADETPKTDVNALGDEHRNLTAAMVEVADKQFQHAARAYGDRVAQNMQQLEAFVHQVQAHAYDSITLSLAQQFGRSSAFEE